MLDTNIALDLLVFNDPGTRALKEALETGAANWLVTAAMRDEFARVLAYPKISHRLQSPGQTGAAALLLYDQLSQLVPVAARAAAHCSDRDDQMFVDLAVACQARLLSKDHALLRLRKRLAGLGATVLRGWHEV